MSFDTWLDASLLFSLRIVPLFTFAPPFTMMQLPRLFRALLAVGLAGAIIGGLDVVPAQSMALQDILPSALHELLTGLALALPFHFLFAGLYLAGRTIDVQSGLGMALIIDPGSQGQVPLVGTIIAYMAGMIIFAGNGLGDVLRIIAASVRVVPLGMPTHAAAIGTVGAQLTLMCTLGFGVVGGLILALFLTDIVIAVLARAVPQMNALVIGIQVKVLVMLALMPLILGFCGSLLARMIALTLESMPRLI